LLSNNNLFKDSQHGFRNKRSCLTNLLKFMEKVAKYLDSSEPVDVIYLDFQKAFDKVPHMRLIARLEEIGIRGKLQDCIWEWLKVRKQRQEVREGRLRVIREED
jgi:ribonuclease P/MRP protein subunit RPP40